MFSLGCASKILHITTHPDLAFTCAPVSVRLSFTVGESGFPGENARRCREKGEKSFSVEVELKSSLLCGDAADNCATVWPTHPHQLLSNSLLSCVQVRDMQKLFAAAVAVT